MSRVRVLLHSAVGWRRLTPGTYLVGRSDECDIVIAGNRASRKHAQVVVTETGATLADLSSANGTHVNGVRIRGPHQVRADDFVVIGDNGLDLTLEPDEGACKIPVLQPSCGASRAAASAESAGSIDSTLGAREGEAPERWIDAWAEGVLAQLEAGSLQDEQARRSAMRFGVELAMNRSSARWVDFVLRLVAYGIPLPPDRARALGPVVEKFGVAASLLDACQTSLRSLAASGDRDAAFALVGSWKRHVRQR